MNLSLFFISPAILADASTTQSSSPVLAIAVMALALVTVASIVNFHLFRRRAESRIRQLESELGNERERAGSLRAEQARQRFVINKLSAVSLIDQVLDASGSKAEHELHEVNA